MPNDLLLVCAYKDATSICWVAAPFLSLHSEHGFVNGYIGQAAGRRSAVFFSLAWIFTSFGCVEGSERGSAYPPYLAVFSNLSFKRSRNLSS